MPELIIGIRLVRIELNRLLERVGGFFRLAFVGQHGTEVVVALAGTGGIQLRGFLQILGRIVDLSGVAVNNTEVVVVRSLRRASVRSPFAYAAAASSYFLDCEYGIGKVGVNYVLCSDLFRQLL
jgi:hypothetical protein